MCERITAKSYRLFLDPPGILKSGRFDSNSLKADTEASDKLLLRSDQKLHPHYGGWRKNAESWEI